MRARRHAWIPVLILIACGGDAPSEATPESITPEESASPIPSYPDDAALNGWLPAEPEEATKAAEAAAARRAKLEAARARAAAKAAEPPPSKAALEALPPLQIVSAVLAHEVVDRAPVREATTFREGIEVVCFNTVASPGSTGRTVRHVWYHEGRRKSSIELAIKAKRWRTWSSRPVYGPGAWRVDIVDEADRVLQSLPFTVTP